MATPQLRGSNNRVRAEILGLRDFIKDLGFAEDQWEKVEKDFFDITVDTLIQRARQTAESEGRLEAKAAQDMYRRGPGTIVYGGEAYSRGAEFGSYQYRQFQTWRGNGDDAGYFLWPTVREFRDEDFINEYADTVLRALKRAFQN